MTAAAAVTTVAAASAAVLAAVSVAAVSPVARRRRRLALRRSRELLGTPVARRRRPAVRRPARSGPRPARSGTAEGRLLVPVAAAVTAVAVGGPPGALAGFGIAVLAHRLQRQRGPAGERAARARHTEQVVRQLPQAADLLAACLAAGAGPQEAAGAVGRSVRGPLGALLLRAAAELRLGADPAQCWERFAAEPGATELGRCLEHACTTGVPPAAAVTRLAEQGRLRHARSAQARARRAGVLATAPLGLCFLPAFLLVGVAPVVMGLAGALLAPA
ncbi:type II secretion system F family protein [Streptomyces sp. SCUT-3]|uniref:type II secretion system F family protein n=1 Tax=Streptomyces sp. SCUT-3 TaxID=2684469 RepID=UPI002174E908|nr:type II secretion system F family protein [Streptomyces sp. SCUT-3]